MTDLETQIASFSTIRDQHRAEIKDQKRELDRLRKVMADHHSKNARLRGLAEDRNMVATSRSLIVTLLLPTTISFGSSSPVSF